ncbi:hypothetical protein Pfo_000526 [Paulownia fortunei]|nr:hypothetical protein Pfo_000526 [Paulownia fortunei]
MPHYKDNYGSNPHRYVGHLSSRIHSRDLKFIFSKYGRVRNVYMKEVREYIGKDLALGFGCCFNCGIDGDWARDYKVGDWKNKCFRCFERGHIQRNCVSIHLRCGTKVRRRLYSIIVSKCSNKYKLYGWYSIFRATYSLLSTTYVIRLDRVLDIYIYEVNYNVLIPSGGSRSTK